MGSVCWGGCGTESRFTRALFAVVFDHAGSWTFITEPPLLRSGEFGFCIETIPAVASLPYVFDSSLCRWARLVRPLHHSIRVLTLGVLVAATHRTASGQSLFGNALSFNGINQYVSVANFGNIIPTNEITVEFWAYTTKAAGQSAFILNPDSNAMRLNGHLNYGGPAPDVGLTYWDFGNINFAIGRLGPIAAPANSISNWIHYAFVASQSGDSMSLYTNGVLQATKSGMTPFVRGAYELRIGGGGFNGRLDDFRVWNTARSQAQIQAAMNQPLAGSETNLVFYYKFDSASGTIATNSATATGSAFNGLLISSPAWVSSSVPIPAPTVATLAATGMSNSVATLQGTVNPRGVNTTAWFEWGLYPFNNTNTTAPVTVGSGLTPITVSNALVGLTPGVNYHARLVASNVAGLFAVGSDVRFGSPAITLNSAAVLTNECHAAFADPGATATGSPLAIASGINHSLALKSDGTVAAWGDNRFGQTNIPVGLSNVVAIARGDFHSLALKSDGTVAAWGVNNYGQTTIPASLSNVVAIAGGGSHSLALKSDGTVAAWGRNGFGQTTVPGGLNTFPANGGGTFNTNNSPGSYTVIYTASNLLGGIATPISRTVVVQDTTPPVITMLGSNSILFTNVNRIYTDPGATALDLCGGVLSVTVINPVNPNIGGTYTVTYTATDNYGNIATNTRTVFVALPPAVIGDANGDGLVSQSELDAVYGNYVTNSPWLYMTNVAGLGGTNVQFSLSNSVLGAYTVQVSTNLVNWINLGPATPRYLFTDTNAPGNLQRYYRLVYP